MTIKNFSISTVVGFLVYWLLGGLFYAYIFKSFLPAMPEDGNESMTIIITFGCFIMAVLFAFVYNRIGGASNPKEAIVNGGFISLIVAAAMHTFYFQLMPEWTLQQRGLDLIINFLMGSITSFAIYFVLKKVDSQS